MLYVLARSWLRQFVISGMWRSPDSPSRPVLQRRAGVEEERETLPRSALYFLARMAVRAGMQLWSMSRCEEIAWTRDTVALFRPPQHLSLSLAPSHLTPSLKDGRLYTGNIHIIGSTRKPTKTQQTLA